MTVAVTAPLPGRVVRLADVPDPVFAGQLVGSGLAIEPGDGEDEVAVLAPVAGKLFKAHPHAFVVLHDDGTGVLVHLGIDTVRLRGAGFTLHVAEGETVTAGQPVVSFRPSAVRAAGLSACCPVVVLDSGPDAVATDAAGSDVAAGDPLFTWPR